MSQLPSSPTKIFDHPIIGIDQQQQFKANYEEMIMDEGNEIPTIELEQPQKVPHAPSTSSQATKKFINFLISQMRRGGNL